MKYRVVHKTEYLYDRPVALCYNEARLTPRNLAVQKCTTSRIDIEPESSAYRQRTDFWGNQVIYFSIQQPHQQLSVTATSEVELHPKGHAFDFTGDRPWAEVREGLSNNREPEWLAAQLLTIDSRLVSPDPELKEYVLPSFPAQRPLLEGVGELTARIFEDFKFDPKSTTVSTPLSEVMQHRRGVCQDFAHLGIGCLRALGLAARYVSGYIETLPPPGEERLIGAAASHAWFSVFAPGKGWVDFDPTNNQMPREHHVTVAWGRDYTDVVPFKGIIFGRGKHQLSVSVDVERTAE